MKQRARIGLLTEGEKREKKRENKGNGSKEREGANIESENYRNKNNPENATTIPTRDNKHEYLQELRMR